MTTNTMTDYDAVMIAEGAQEGDQLAAFAQLVRTGMAWTLQGFFGRAASRLIEAGYLSNAGDILRRPEDDED